MRADGTGAEISANDVTGGVEGRSSGAGNNGAAFGIDAALINLQQVFPQRNITGGKHSFRESDGRVFAPPLREIRIGDFAVNLDVGRVAGVSCWESFVCVGMRPFVRTV